MKFPVTFPRVLLNVDHPQNGVILALIFALICTAGSVAERPCGAPGQWEPGGLVVHSASTSAGVYRPGQSADYACSPGFTLVGNTSRLCRDDGSWSGHWPRCAVNVALGQPVVTSRLVAGDGQASAVVDGRVDTCLYFDMRADDRFIQIDLGRNRMIRGVVLHVPPMAGSMQEVSIFVAEKLTSSTGIQYRRCVNSLTQIRSPRRAVECVAEPPTSAAGVPGRFIHIRDEKKVRDYYFALCEIDVYLVQEETPLCGIPDRPAHGDGIQRSSHLYEFRCQSGFHLVGSRFAHCQNGRWTEATPTCVVVECPPPASVDHGTVDLLSASGFANATFNSVAQYRCADGYVLAPDWDAATRTCGADGRWTGTPPFCRPVDCGLPRSMMNAFYQLSEPNESNGTRPGAVARYGCNRGFVAQRIVADKPLQMVSVCLNSGSWRDVHFYCAFSATTTITTSIGSSSSTTPSTIDRSFVNEPPDAGINARPNRPLPEVDFIQITSASTPSPVAGGGASLQPTDDVSTLVAVGIAAAFVLVFALAAVVTLSACRTRVSGDSLKQSGATSVTSTDQLIADCQCVRTESRVKETEDAVNVLASMPAMVATSAAASLAAGEPVYNEVDVVPTLQPWEELDDVPEEETFYLDIDDSGWLASMEASTASPQSSQLTSMTPDDVQQLYARVDKSKKLRNRSQEAAAPTEAFRRAPLAQEEDEQALSPDHKAINLLVNQMNVRVHLRDLADVDAAAAVAPPSHRMARWPRHVCGKDAGVTEQRPLPPLPAVDDAHHMNNVAETTTKQMYS